MSTDESATANGLDMQTFHCACKFVRKDEFQRAVQVDICAYHAKRRSAIQGIAPWLSASLSDPESTTEPCQEYIDACQAIFEADQTQ